MIEKIKEIQSVQGNRIFYFESENVYYSVTIDKKFKLLVAIIRSL